MIRELSPELAQIAKTELNENPNTTPSDITYLKEWISKQPHLRARTDDQWLVALLRGCKFSLEKVKTKIDLFYTLRSTASDITLKMKPTESEFIDFLRLGTILILPKSQKLTPRTIIIRAGRFDIEHYHVAHLMCLLYYLVQILVVEDDTASIVGTKIVVDYEDVTMNHFKQINPTFLRKMITLAQDSLPLRLSGSHHINLPSGVEIIFKLISGFLSQKAKDRLQIHNSYDELQEKIPKDILPVEYGGDGESIADIIGHWEKKVVEYRSWMEYEMTLGTDESKRPGKSCGSEISEEGSFRKLDID
ncbi:unnamed protein product [Leptidea sinapis]|uniref:CRAL-TRIO domain-containing protein n=1 Tax=Leptidea sinapis TaxID=189913 RepID=A0A5E4Q2U6_9NEOP|nr:unnamed protein product [Leptidea sinapis]